MGTMKVRFSILLLVLIPGAVGIVGDALGQERAVDVANSKLRVHVFKSGVFSGFADNHDVEAPIAEGTIDEGASRVKFVVRSREMKVLDPKLPADKRGQVQERMLGPEVLDTAAFPEIRFESTEVERSEGQLVVRGRLSLHGVTRAVSASVRKEGGRYLGTCTLKQREFGIKPVTIAGGTVKVKDEVKIDFDVRAGTGASGDGK